MKATTSLETIPFYRPAGEKEIARFCAATESILLAMRYVSSISRDKNRLERAFVTVEFLAEMLDEIRAFQKSPGSSAHLEFADSLEVWSIELQFLSEEMRLQDLNDSVDTLVLILADACLWLRGILLEEEWACSSEKEYLSIVDSLATGAMQVVISKTIPMKNAA